MADRINSIMSSLLAPVAIAVCLFVPLASAQAIDPLPPSDQTSYPVVEQQQIATYVLNRVAAIGDGEAAVRERAKSELLTPLRRAGVSVAFRRLVSGAGVDQLTRLADGADEEVATNAMFVLAEIGDDRSRLVLQQHTDDDTQTMRYAAVSAMKRTFRVVDAFAPAIDPGRVSEMVSHLLGRLETETHRDVADVITRALLQASRIHRSDFSAASNRALVGLAGKAGARLCSADDGTRVYEAINCLRVAEELAGRLASADTPPAEVTRAGAGFSGEVLGRLAFHANNGNIPATRELEIGLVTLCERNIVFAGRKLGGAIEAPGLAAMLRAGDDKGFYEATRRLVLALSGKPCNLPPDVMQRIRDALERE